MQIVIDVDENVFTRLFDNGTEDYEIMDDDLFAIVKSIRNGTPLPKGHGRLIDADELLKAMDTWDKFGKIPNRGLIPLRTTALQDIYVLYVKYDDMVNCVKGMPSMTPQEPRKGHWIADVDRWGDVVTTVNGYRCDKCNAFNSDKDNYCPNCGADMREAEE